MKRWKGQFNMNLANVNKSSLRTQSQRFIELDVLRGFAIIFMIFLHIIWDLDYFGLVSMNNQIYQFQKIVPSMFFLLLGICLVVSKNKKINQSSYNEKRYNQHVFLRGLKIFGLGMILTMVTMIFMPDRPIIFGVLHCIGFSIILSIPFLKFKSYNILFATLIILIGVFIGQYTIENPTVFHLTVGLHQANIARYTIDYFPLFPWFGVSLLGIVLGNLLYKDGERRFKIPNLSNYKPVTVFSWLGQHSLGIYLVHQPIIMGALSIFVIF